MRRERHELLGRPARGGIRAGRGEGVDDPGPGEAPAGDGGPAGGERGPTVQVRSHPEHGDILVGPGEETLYMCHGDVRGAGSTVCSGNCANAWPPLTVDGEPTRGGAVSAELGTFGRADGATQVTCDGWPLYAFVNDEAPGDADGQGINDAWCVLRPDGTPSRPRGDLAAAGPDD